MKINVGKIIKIKNNNYIILGIDNKKYEYFNNHIDYQVGDLVYFRGEKIHNFHKAFFTDKLDCISDQEKHYILDLLKNKKRNNN